ncbi:MAG: hypothetical protein IIC02_12360 [Planctomycetes bacterium]|nr:hypothetical protein [Planctomycetota bacterium]
MNAHRGSHSENRNRPTGLTGKTGCTNGSGFTSLAGRSRLVPVYVVLTAAMILLCRPIAATAADGESKTIQRVVADKSAGVVKISVGQTALSGFRPTQSVASPKQTSARPTDPQDTSSSIGRAGGCVATNEGMLSSLGGSWSGDTTFSTDNFEASVLGCNDESFGRDEIFQFTVDAGGIWKFDTCTVPA